MLGSRPVQGTSDPVGNHQQSLGVVLLPKRIADDARHPNQFGVGEISRADLVRW
jgi:hypothetical protein